MRLILSLLVLISCQFGYSSSGIWEYYIDTKLNSTSSFFGNYANGISFNGANLGSNLNLNTDALFIDLSGCKTFQNNGDDIQSARMYYRVYKQGGPTGVFVSQNLPYFSGNGNPNKEWQNGSDINLLSGITTTGTYFVEMYYEATGVNNGNNFNIYESNGGANFIASFTVSTPLPVEIVKLIAVPRNNEVMLDWRTESELNNSHFCIERSTNDLRSWGEIGQLQGNGTITAAVNYSFLDKQPLQGINYYRLKQVDFDGKYEYSKVVSVIFNGSGFRASIFPNPVSDVLNIAYANDSPQELSLMIHNSFGVQIQAGFPFNNQLEVTALPAGIYWLTLKDESGRVLANERFFKK